MRVGSQRYCPLCDTEMEHATCPEHDVPTLNPTQALDSTIETQLLAGTTFADRYILEQIIGTGGVGTIFLAMQRSTQRKIALKILHPQLVRRGTWLTRFYRESRAVSQLDHPNIVRVMDFGIDVNTHQPFLAMSYIEGKSLGDVLRDGPLGETRTAHILSQVARALVAAHVKGVIHRDLKPENIMVQELPEGGEHVTVCDFGVARTPDQSALRATQSGMIVGTPAYMSPEQVSCAEADFRSDLYSLGCILHECVVGRPPFDEQSPVACLLAHVSRDPPPLPDRLTDGAAPSAALAKLERWLMMKQPERRPQSTKLVLDVLSALSLADPSRAEQLLEAEQANTPVVPLVVPPSPTDVSPAQPGLSDMNVPDTDETRAPINEFAETMVTQTERAPPSPRGVSVRESKEGAVAVLPAMVDEHFDSATLYMSLGARGPIVFDFDRVRRITSYGIREWVDFLSTIADDRYYCFVRCHPHVMAQFNVLENFGGKGELLSFYVPYICPQCRERMELLVDVISEKARIDVMKHPPMQCARCRIDTELDDLPEIYFSYVASKPTPAPPPVVSALIASISSSPSREVSMGVTKEISEKLTIFKLRGIIDEKASFRRLAEGVEGIVLVDLAGVTEVRGPGVERFLEFLSKLDCEIHLVNAQLAIVERLFEQPQSEALRISTISGAARCDQCGQEKSMRLTRDEPSKVAQRTCCGRELSGMKRVEARLQESQGTDEIARYLERTNAG